MTSDDLNRLARTVQRTIEREVRLFGLRVETPALPPPADVDAEAEIIALLLMGYLVPERLRPLEARHFYARFHQLIFSAAEAVCERGEVCELDTIAAELDARGYVGPVREDLEQARDTVPFTCSTTVQRYAAFCKKPMTDVTVSDVSARLVELWSQRELIRVMQNIDVALRAGALDRAGARKALRKHFVGDKK